MTLDLNWKAFYVLRPRRKGDFKYPFVFDDSTDARPILLHRNGAALSEWKTPPHSALDSIRHAMSLGAIPIAAWDVEWGLSMALSPPKSHNGLIVLDDYSTGRFVLFGISDVGDLILAGNPESKIVDLEYAVIKTLRYGCGKELKRMAKVAEKSSAVFKINNKNRRYFKDIDYDNYIDKPLVPALKEIQAEYTPDPMLILGSTVSIIQGIGHE